MTIITGDEGLSADRVVNYIATLTALMLALTVVITPSFWQVLGTCVSFNQGRPFLLVTRGHSISPRGVPSIWFGSWIALGLNAMILFGDKATDRNWKEHV